MNVAPDLTLDDVDSGDPLERVMHRGLADDYVKARGDCSPIMAVCGYVGSPCRPLPDEKCPMCFDGPATREFLTRAQRRSPTRAGAT